MCVCVYTNVAWRKSDFGLQRLITYLGNRPRELLLGLLTEDDVEVLRCNGEFGGMNKNNKQTCSRNKQV